MSNPPQGRWVALDRLRAIAVLLMIQGHLFHELLDPAAQTGPWYRLHKLFHGMTAPMFLMGAGLAFGLTTYPRWETFRSTGPEHAARLRRYALIVLLGYALQLPGHSVTSLFSRSPEVWAQIVKVGPLQLIGILLFFAQLGTRVIANPRVHAALALLLGLLVVSVSPFVWNLAPGDVSPTGLEALLHGHRGSQFPAFPWAAFLCFALALSALSTSPRGLRWLRSGATWSVGGALACGTTYTLYRLHVNPYGEHDFWHSNPLYVGFRAGGVALWLAAASLFAGRARRLDRGLAILARHSLFAYVAHLLILYGSFPVPGFVHVLGRDSLSIPEATAASLLLIGLTVALIVTWRHVQHTRLIPNGFQSLTRLLARCDIRALALRAWTKGTPHTVHSEGSLAAARHDEPPVRAPLGSVSPSPRSS